ncbi:MAG: hypothetical protein U9R05_01890, partial [Chloroflexota bacterium]|nr:hypothetical protein [Chloroflexota bacterium]
EPTPPAPLTSTSTMTPTLISSPNGEETGTKDVLSKTLGILAVYAAFMAALAAGVEVITDLFRPIFGLERQPQAMETLQGMKEWLPATLKEMDATPEAQARLQGFLTELEQTAQDVTDAAQPEKIAQEIQKWALATVKSAGGLLVGQVDAKLGELVNRLLPQESFEQAVKHTLAQLNLQGLGLDAQTIAALVERVQEQAQTLVQQVYVKVIRGDSLEQAIIETLQNLMAQLPPAAQLSDEQLAAVLQKIERGVLESLPIKGPALEQAVATTRQFLQALQGSAQFSPAMSELKELLQGLGLKTPQIDQVIAKALEMMEVLAESQQLAQKKAELQTLLQGFGLEPSQAAEIVAKALDALNALKGGDAVQQIINLASSLDAFSDMLNVVEAERHDMTGYLRRLWRALRDWEGWGLLRRLPDKPQWAELRKRSALGALCYLLEKAWNYLWGKGEPGVQQDHTLILTPDTAAQTLRERDRFHRQRESIRQRQLRLVTVIVGFVLAFWLRVDSLELLKPLFGGNLPKALFMDGNILTLEQIFENLLNVQWKVAEWTGLGKLLFSWIAIATPGMLISGLAASGGSSFWHDQLDRLRAAKQTTEQVSTVVSVLSGAEK